MSSSIFLNNLIGLFLLPPLSPLLGALAGLLVSRSRPRLGRTLLVLSLALLWVCSSPYFAGHALNLLERSFKPLDPRSHPADAIVVLGGGTYRHAPEYGSDTVSETTLVRLRYAARLQRATGKPILVTGGKPQNSDLSEAQQMKSVLEQEFMTPVRWTENASNNTEENARYSYRILHQAGVRRIYLVTHAWHMQRSVATFESAGFEVIPAPTAYTPNFKFGLLSLLPEAHALYRCRTFVHELIGMLWYRLRY